MPKAEPHHIRDHNPNLRSITMKFISNAIILALAGSASAKLNSPRDRNLQLGGIFGGSDNETSILGGLADTVSGAVDTVSGAVDGIVNTTSGAIGDFVGENTTLPELPSIEGIANATQDFVSGVVNTTSNMIPDFNGTLDGFIPEGGLGPVIPGESNETATPETLPESTGSTVAPETLPAGTTVAAETGSTVSAAGTSAPTDTEDDEGEEEHHDEDGHDHDEDMDDPDDEDDGSAASSMLISTFASVVSVTLLLNVF